MAVLRVSNPAVNALSSTVHRALSTKLAAALYSPNKRDLQRPSIIHFFKFRRVTRVLRMRASQSLPRLIACVLAALWSSHCAACASCDTALLVWITGTQLGIIPSLEGTQGLQDLWDSRKISSRCLRVAQ